MPKTLDPMLAEIGDAPFNDAAWMWEPKLDGYRVLAFVEDGRARLSSRRGVELAAAFPQLVAELVKQDANGMILDGELVAFDANGKPSFNAMQNRVQLKTERDIAAADRKSPVVFYCFDLLYFAGIDLRRAVYRDRRRYLSQCLLPSPLVQLVHAQDDGIALHAAALASGLEGVIGKRKDSRYEAGKRSGSWLKIKPTHSADFVIGGYTRGKGSRDVARLAARRLLGSRQAALRLARRFRLRRSLARPRSRRGWIRCASTNVLSWKSPKSTRR